MKHYSEAAVERMMKVQEVILRGMAFRRLCQLEPIFQTMSKILASIRNRTRQIRQSDTLSHDEKTTRVRNLYLHQQVPRPGRR